MKIAGLYPILGPEVLPLAEIPAAARALADLGVSVMQVRLKAESDLVRLEVLRAVAAALGAYPGLLVVNDRPDLAYVLAMEAPQLDIGLHLGQDDIPPALARAVVGPDVVIGLSTHTLEQVRAGRSEPVDYLAFGPIFYTTTKARTDPVVGVEGLRLARKAVTMPLVAIGGIAVERARSVYKAGADALAVASGLFGGTTDPASDTAKLGARVAAFREAADARVAAAGVDRGPGA